MVETERRPVAEMLAWATSSALRLERASCGCDGRATENEFNGIGGMPIYVRGGAGMRTPFGLESGRSNARDLCQCRRWRRSNCACRDLFTVGGKGTQITPSGRRQAPVDFLSDVGLCEVV